MTCENLSFNTMCVVPVLEEIARGEECDHDSFKGVSSFCQEREGFEECVFTWGKALLAFPCSDGEIASLIEYRAQVSLNHLLHEGDDFWID